MAHVYPPLLRRLKLIPLRKALFFFQHQQDKSQKPYRESTGSPKYPAETWRPQLQSPEEEGPPGVARSTAGQHLLSGERRGEGLPSDTSPVCILRKGVFINPN